MASTFPTCLSADSNPLFVFTAVQLRHDDVDPSTHPSIIGLQQWTRQSFQRIQLQPIMD